MSAGLSPRAVELDTCEAVAAHPLVGWHRHDAPRAVRTGDERVIRAGCGPYRLLEEALEEHPSGSGTSSVKAEGELVEIRPEMCRLDTP
ncbi:MAG: hypothetical protein ACRD0B_09670 [Acidimicrobiales bacterium]